MVGGLDDYFDCRAEGDWQTGRTSAEEATRRNLHPARIHLPRRYLARLDGLPLLVPVAKAGLVLRSIVRSSDFQAGCSAYLA